MEHKIKNVLLVAVLLTSAVAGIAVATDDGADVTPVTDAVEQSDDESDWSDGDSDSDGNEDNSSDGDCEAEMKANITFDK